jgi:acyl-CoA reductase-like NAD-dependent aldehyde dehydrogenase
MTERHTNASEHFEERAAILEYCAAYPRREAERLAKAEVAKWLKAHPEGEHGND